MENAISLIFAATLLMSANQLRLHRYAKNSAGNGKSRLGAAVPAGLLLAAMLTAAFSVPAGFALEAKDLDKLRTSFTSVAFSPDGRFVLTGAMDKTLRLWDAATGAEIRSFAGHAQTVHAVAFSPDGRKAVSGGNDRQIKLWDVAAGVELRTLHGHSHPVRSVAFSPNGRFILSGGCDIEEKYAQCPNSSVKLWDAAPGTELRSFTGQTGDVRSVTFSPDGGVALSASLHGIKLWDIETGRELRSLDGRYPAVFSPDGRFVLSSGGSTSLKLWDARSGQEVRSFDGHTVNVEAIAFSPDGRSALFDGGDYFLKSLNIASGEVRSFSERTWRVSSLAFSPDGTKAVSGAANTLKLWDVAKGQILRPLSGAESPCTLDLGPQCRR
jgi:WD40 repeat protein